MSDIKLIPLKCPSCGAQLDIPSDGNNVTCSFCGTPLVVDRDDYGVMLKPLAESLAQVRAELERTTATLVVRRMQDEIVALKNGRNALETNAKAAVNRRYAEIAFVESRSPVSNTITIGIVAFLAALVVVQVPIDLLTRSQNYAWIGFIIAILACGGASVYFYRRMMRSRIDKVAKLHEQLNTEWAAAQLQIAAEDKQLKDLHAEIEKQQRIATG